MTNQNKTTPPQNTMSTSADSGVVMAILAYLGILVIIPFLVAKNNPFVKFHIKQGLVLLVIEIILWFLMGVTWMFYPIWAIVKLALLVLVLIGIVNAVQKKEKELPVVGVFAKHFTI